MTRSRWMPGSASDALQMEMEAQKSKRPHADPYAGAFTMYSRTVERVRLVTDAADDALLPVMNDDLDARA